MKVYDAIISGLDFQTFELTLGPALTCISRTVLSHEAQISQRLGFPCLTTSQENLRQAQITRGGAKWVAHPTASLFALSCVERVIGKILRFILLDYELNAPSVLIQPQN